MVKGLRALIIVTVVSLTLGAPHGQRLGTPGAAEAAGCDLRIKAFTGVGQTIQFTGSYLPNTTRVKIEVTPNNCVWKVDRTRARTADWLTTKVVSGNPQLPDGTFSGSAYVDLIAERNLGVGRNTTIYFAISPPGNPSSYASTQMVQGSIRDYCQPMPTVIGTTQNSIVEPGFLVLTDYGRPTGTPSVSVQYRFRDAAKCATTASVIAQTPNLNLPSTRALRETPPDKFLFQHAGITVQQPGGAALARLGDSQSFWQGRSAVLVRYLLRRDFLPEDLRIDPEMLSKYVVAVTDGGAIVEVTGHAVRSRSNPTRPCAFDPRYYHVVEENGNGRGIQWLKLVSGTACNPGSPDDGKLVISVYPAPKGVSRLGAIYSDWGSAIMIVQR